ncbi:glycosyltransferase family 4 protein [Alphaproteobacteria bacterium]|nr:glycosyltransferase family 4 protein [Alphaproteobacteria bacterium]
MIVAIVGTTARSFLLFRKSLIQKILETGSSVHLFVSSANSGEVSELRRLGVNVHFWPLRRASINPWHDIRSVLFLCRKFKSLGVEVVLSFFLKPVIYGSLAAKIAGATRIIGLIEGLGVGFTPVKNRFSFGYLYRLLLRTVQSLLLFAVSRFASALITLNHDDYRIIRMIAVRSCPVRVLGGIGVQLSNFKFSRVNDGANNFVFIGRLIKDKGIVEFLAASEKLIGLGCKATFTVVGDADPDRADLDVKRILDRCVSNNVVTHIPCVDDINEVLSSCTVFVLPSYREGMPRSTQEAMAVGRAVITTYTPGCRETVVPGFNGLLVPIFDTCALSEAMIKLIKNPKLVRVMGHNSRRMAESLFDSEAKDILLLSYIMANSALDQSKTCNEG